MSILALITPPSVDKLSLATRMLSILSENNINVEMISHGASNNNIACVISNEESIKAMQLVHDECIIESLQKSDELKEKLFEDEEISTTENSSTELSIATTDSSIKTAVIKPKKSNKLNSIKRFFSLRLKQRKNAKVNV